MDLGSTIIGAILIAISIVPIILMGKNRKKREKKALQSLIKIANQQNCIISKHENCSDFVIGMDEIKNVVFFYKNINDKELEQVVDLNVIQNCKVINTSRTIKNKDGNQKVIDRLELSFIPTNKNEPGIKMEFFNSNISTQLDGELQSIEKWSKHINDRLKQNK